MVCQLGKSEMFVQYCSRKTHQPKLDFQLGAARFSLE